MRRRISLALALLGTVAATGCSSSSGSGNGSTFKVEVRGERAYFDPLTSTTLFLPDGGRVTGPGGIDCGIVGGVASKACSAGFPWGTSDAPTTVVLTATPDGANGYEYFAFAGSCTGDTCSLTGNSDHMTLVRFAKTAAALGVHSAFSSPAVHGPAFRLNSYQCTDCHGATLHGQGLAPSCFGCHIYTFPVQHAEPILLGDHFLATSPAFGDHGSGWSTSCLRCHTTQGFRDYVGADGSANYLVTSPWGGVTSTVGSTTAACIAVGNCAPGAYKYGPLKCDACHNSVTEPSGAGITQITFRTTTVTTDKVSALCGQCHQGRESTSTVNAKIGSTALDTVIAKSNSFLNPHYLGAAATVFGGNAQMWAQYPGKTYAGTFTHGGLSSCTYCHDAHTGHVEVTPETCGRCHDNTSGAPVASLAELEESRQVGFTTGDIDGDGTVEGLKAEIEGLEETLYTALEAYATNVVGTSIVYDGASHPYYFIDANGNGQRDGYVDGVAIVGFDPALADSAAYNKFTPRSLRAAFNYKWAHAEPGAWAHNIRYAVEILYDAITDLNAGLGANAIPFNGVRSFAAAPIDALGGHFQAEGHNSGSCARCHAGDGFRDYIGADGTADNHLAAGSNAAKAAALDNSAFASGISCDACHNAQTVLGGGALKQIRFPDAKIVTTDGETAICGQCHTGARDDYNAAQLAIKIGSTAVDAQIPSSNSVVRAHYLPAASTLFGAEAANWYQYPGYIYTARNEHGGKGSCTSCHDAHSGALPADAEIATKCGVCHLDEVTDLPVASFFQLEESRQFGFEGDVDGDGTAEPLKAEVDGLATVLYAAIQAYAKDVVGTEICAVDNRYYIVTSPATACNVAPNTTQYNKFTPRLLRAGYNYLIWQNDAPGAWAHNPRYVVEVLFDTITDLNAGLSVAGKTPVAFNGKRAFDGHFGGAEDASPYAAMVYHAAPPQGFTSAACYQCHGGKGGFAEYLADPIDPVSLTTLAKVTALQCGTCHVDGDDMTGIRSDVSTLYFPPQKPAAQQTQVDAAAAFSSPADRVCATCHSGREGTASLDVKIGTKTDAEWTISFTNPHYLGAAGVWFGATVHMMYEYSGKTYLNDPTLDAAPAFHVSCVGCHEPKASKHTFEVDLAGCAGCHDGTGAPDLAALKANVDALAAQLYTKITAYSQAQGHAVCYNGNAHPYWFVDANSNGSCDAGETTSSNLNPKASRAAFNYKWSQAEPGAYAHNHDYVLQVLIDSILDLDPTATPAVPRP